MSTATVKANEEGYDAGIEGAARKNPGRDGSPVANAYDAGYDQGAQDRRENDRSDRDCEHRRAAGLTFQLPR
jgi:hypothetical protein